VTIHLSFSSFCSVPTPSPLPLPPICNIPFYLSGSSNVNCVSSPNLIGAIVSPQTVPVNYIYTDGNKTAAILVSVPPTFTVPLWDGSSVEYTSSGANRTVAVYVDTAELKDVLGGSITECGAPSGAVPVGVVTVVTRYDNNGKTVESGSVGSVSYVPYPPTNSDGALVVLAFSGCGNVSVLNATVAPRSNSGSQLTFASDRGTVFVFAYCMS
jgi:hypothetical protein